jgi:CRISPR-associated protein Cas1
MKKLLNTLYVTSADAYLGRDGENVVVRIDNEVKFRIPIHNLEGIVTFGYTGASPALMQLCAAKGVALSFLSRSGRFVGRVTPPASGNVLLRKRQYSVSDNDSRCLALAKSFIIGKLANSRSVLRRFLRDHGTDCERGDLEHAAAVLTRQLESITRVDTVDELRGIEGEGARIYFSTFNHLILATEGAFEFTGRSRRPPRDPVNALLSFLYTLLTHDCIAALETVGLDPQVGFLHRIRPGRPSLALDLMEELRPYLADRLTLTLINNRQVTVKDFVAKESGGVLMSDQVRKTVIDVWQKRKQQKITHPFFKETMEVGLLPYAQALLLARHLRGDLEAYPPYLVR